MESFEKEVIAQDVRCEKPCWGGSVGGCGWGSRFWLFGDWRLVGRGGESLGSRWRLLTAGEILVLWGFVR